MKLMFHSGVYTANTGKRPIVRRTTWDGKGQFCIPYSDLFAVGKGVDCLLLQGAPAANGAPAKKGKGSKAAAAEAPQTDAAKLEVALAELEALGAKNLVLEQQRGLAILERVRASVEAPPRFTTSFGDVVAPCA